MQRILLLGSGGREHALAWKITQSPLCEALFIAPGNAGTAACGQNVSISPTDFDAVANFVADQHISLIVVGPEEPLVRGIWDYFQQHPTLSHIPVIGPSREGAQLEGSKDYAKRFMQRHGIPTATYRTFTAAEQAAALEYVHTHPLPIVLKADGLAAGKGVLICDTLDEAIVAVTDILGGKFGEAGHQVVIEQFLQGIECSFFVLTDGHSYVLLPEAKDYKRIGEGDTGPNTGGMGAVSPVPFVDDGLRARIVRDVIEPTIEGLRREHIVYRGFIFFGLMIVNETEPYVIEYNCRMGDPETEVVIPRLQRDLVSLLVACGAGQLAAETVAFDVRTAVTVMLVSGGYPGDYEKGKEVVGLERVAPETLTFHAGTVVHNDAIRTAGGRVLALTSYGYDVSDATAASLAQAQKIDFEGKYYRRDIGRDLGAN